MQEGEHASLDRKTAAWARENSWCCEFAVRECKTCGLFYKPELGHDCGKTPKLEFSRVIGNIEVRACPPRLISVWYGEPNDTIDVVMWQKDANGKPYCISIAYFARGDEGYSLKFVGARPFLYVDEIRVPELWKALHEAQKVLDTWFDETEGAEG